MNQRIQFIRALAIIAVVAIHTPADSPYVVFIRPFLNFAVAMFLFLSACLTADKVRQTAEPDYSRLIKNRLSRLLPTYALWVVIASLPSVLLQLLHHTCTIRSVGGTLFWMSLGVPYYFFVVYLQLLLLHPLLERLAASRWWAAGLLLTPISLCAIYGIFLSGTHLPGMLHAIPFPVWFGYYYLGILLVIRTPKGSWSLSSLWGIWAASILLQMAEGWFWYSSEGPPDLTCSQLRFSSWLTSNISCLLAFTYICREDSSPLSGLWQRCMLLIGNCSMGIFLCHCSVILIWNVLSSVLGFSKPLYPTVTLVVLLGSLLLILLCNRLLPTPCVRLLGFSCKGTQGRKS